MDAEVWAKTGVFIWLGAYLLFFIGGFLLYTHERSVPRALIAVGLGMLLIVNLMLLAEFWDITNITYNPVYEDSSSYGWGNEDLYPQWQRWYYWTGVAMDVLGKTLAGIGLIMEGRQQITKRRMADYYNNLPTS